MALPPPPPGWARYLVASKFGMGRKFNVLDPTTEQLIYLADGKVGVRPTCEVKDADGMVIYLVRGQMLAIPKRMAISDASGVQVAELKAKAFSPIKTRMTLTVPNGSPWQIEGSLMEKNYSISRDGAPAAHITQKWVTIRDRYTLDVAEGVDPALALAIVWAVDRWVERD